MIEKQEFNCHDLEKKIDNKSLLINQIKKSNEEIDNWL